MPTPANNRQPDEFHFFTMPHYETHEDIIRTRLTHQEAVAMSRWLNRVLTYGPSDLWITVPTPPEGVHITGKEEIAPSQPDPPSPLVKEYLAMGWRPLVRPSAQIIRLSAHRKE